MYWLNGLLMILYLGIPARTVGSPVFSTPTLYLADDTLMVDIRVDSVFSARDQDAIASGMTTSIAYDFVLAPVGRAKPIRRTVSFHLEHDIWEGTFRAIRHGAVTDTLITDSLTEATRYCSVVTGSALARLTDRTPFILRVRARVNPISVEQEARTRKWLNLLDRGSVLELFFSLEPKNNQKNWTEIARFRKSDLPTDLPSPDIKPIQQGETP